MLVLFTDFGAADPYVGQLHAVLARDAPEVPRIDLLHSVPAYHAQAGAHLLAAYYTSFPPGSVFLTVVDPGVGSDRAALVLIADGRFFVGPDNGLLSVVRGRNADARLWRIDWRPQVLSKSFHGRDLLAPVAARIAKGDFPHAWLSENNSPACEFDAGNLPYIIYIDHFGNAITGIRAGTISKDFQFELSGHRIGHADVYFAVPHHAAFWFENSQGLVEIAVNRGSAQHVLNLAIGQPVAGSKE